MSKFHFPGHGAVVKEIQETLEREAEACNEEIKCTSLMLLNAQDGVYGSHQNLPTVYREKWLAKLREERDNPMLGKSYISRAPEYETDADVVTEAHELSDQETKDMFVTDENGNKYIPETYNPNVDDSQTSDLDDEAKKVIDLAIIQNVATKCIGWDFEDVMKECAMAFEDEYGEDFVLPDNMDEIVTEAVNDAEMKARITYKKSEENVK